jgi:hypothetical protein
VNRDRAAGTPARTGCWNDGTIRPILDAMPDDLHDRDVLAWSEHQATLLRRAARGERVNEIDWTHVVQAIEDVGLSELNAVHSYLRHILVHLLKLQGWPTLAARRHWRSEVVAFQTDAQRRFAPSMRQRIDVEAIYARAVLQIEPLRYGGRRAAPLPAACPVTLDALLSASCSALEAVFRASQTHLRGSGGSANGCAS